MIKATLRIAAIALVVLPLAPLQLLALRRRWPLAGWLPLIVHRAFRTVTGLRVTVEGEAAPGHPLLLAANHVSWLDIPVLGSVLPVSFVAKSEVATWPVAGFLARMQRSVFIERDRRHRTGVAARAIAERLADGETIALFAEGTTGDGVRLLPFRPALLGAARHAFGRTGHPVMVQPVAIAYVRRAGLPIGRAGMPAIAWTGDSELLPHLLALLNGPPIDAVVRFGRARPFENGTDRKALARDLEAEVGRLTKGA